MRNCRTVLEECWLKIKTFLRAPCPALRKNWPFFLLVIYAFVSLAYQASAFWHEQTLGTGRVDYRVISELHPIEQYQLAIRYPTTIPLEAAGKHGRPLIAWLWQIPSTTTTTIISVPISIEPIAIISTTPGITSVTSIFDDAINILTATNFLTSTDIITPTMIWRLLITVSDEGTTSAIPTNNLIFTDKNGVEIPSILDLQPGLLEPEAPRGGLYVSRLANSDGNSRARLNFQLWRGDSCFTLIPITNFPVIVKLETYWAAFWRKLCDLILNTPALTWVSVLTIGVNLWIKRREKKMAEAKELHHQIQSLKDMPIQQAWETYWSLYRMNNNRQELARTWKEIETLHPFETSKVIREWLTDFIQRDRLDAQEWRYLINAQSSLSEEEIKDLRAFFI